VSKGVVCMWRDRGGRAPAVVAAAAAAATAIACALTIGGAALARSSGSRHDSTRAAATPPPVMRPTGSVHAVRAETVETAPLTPPDEWRYIGTYDTPERFTAPNGAELGRLPSDFDDLSAAIAAAPEYLAVLYPDGTVAGFAHKDTMYEWVDSSQEWALRGYTEAADNTPIYGEDASTIVAHVTDNVVTPGGP